MFLFTIYHIKIIKSHFRVCVKLGHFLPPSVGSNVIERSLCCTEFTHEDQSSQSDTKQSRSIGTSFRSSYVLNIVSHLSLSLFTT